MKTFSKPKFQQFVTNTDTKSKAAVGKKRIQGASAKPSSAQLGFLRKFVRLGFIDDLCYDNPPAGVSVAILSYLIDTLQAKLRAMPCNEGKEKVNDLTIGDLSGDELKISTYLPTEAQLLDYAMHAPLPKKTKVKTTVVAVKTNADGSDKKPKGKKATASKKKKAGLGDL